MSLLEEYQARAVGKNINPQTLLATDYLNHFNEVHMLIDMLPDMPDCFEDIQVWQPKSYEQHFRDSGFHAKNLAIEAYQHSPKKFRLPFEQVVVKMDKLVLNTIEAVEKNLHENNMGKLRIIVEEYTPIMSQLIEECSAIINGTKVTTHQDSIDHYFDDDEDKIDGEDLDQGAIDDMFG